MGGQGITGVSGSASQMPNYGQPVGANLGASNVMPLSNATFDPNNNKFNMTGMSYANEQPIGGNAQPLNMTGMSYGNEQPIGGNYSGQPLAMGGIASQMPNNFVNNALQGTGQTTPTQNPYGANPYANSTDPFIQASQQTQFGNVIGAEKATAANRVNQQTPFGSLTYTQTGIDANGNPIWSANQSFSPEVAGTMSNISNQINRNIGQGFNPQLPSYGINPNEAYSDAILRRLEPVQERQQKALDARLANQGIMRGSEAYQNAMTDFGQRQNDQLTSAIVGGMQTGLQANQQAYNQAFGNYNLPLAQLGAYRQATSPNYVNPYTQAAVSGPDILGAYTSSEAARIAEMNAEAARQAALTGGLFQLGGSALSNPSSVSNLGGLINKGIGAAGDFLGGLF
jgi:hypothetical protein